MSPDDIKMFTCKDCGMNTAPTVGNEFYAVTDDVWKKAEGGEGILCIGCLELRLSRELAPNDFPYMPINFIFPQSERLAARLGPKNNHHRRNVERILAGKEAVPLSEPLS